LAGKICDLPSRKLILIATTGAVTLFAIGGAAAQENQNASIPKCSQTATAFSAALAKEIENEIAGDSDARKYLSSWLPCVLDQILKLLIAKSKDRDTSQIETIFREKVLRNLKPFGKVLTGVAADEILEHVSSKIAPKIADAAEEVLKDYISNPTVLKCTKESISLAVVNAAAFGIGTIRGRTVVAGLRQVYEWNYWNFIKWTKREVDAGNNNAGTSCLNDIKVDIKNEINKIDIDKLKDPIKKLIDEILKQKLRELR